MDRLYWEVFMHHEKGLCDLIDATSSFMHIYVGDVREAVAHTDKINKFGRVIYNEAAWDSSKFKDIKDDITQPTHFDTINEVIFRIKKYGVEKIDLGYLGRWKNPYQLADTSFPIGITVTYEKLEEDYYSVSTSFFTPGHWFSIQCKPLFRTDPMVMKDAKGSWNMNPTGLIAAKPEKSSANRRTIYSMIANFIREFNPDFSGLCMSKIFFNHDARSAYVMDPDAKDEETKIPLLYSFRDDGFIYFSDSTEVPESKYKYQIVGNQRVHFEKSHFDFM